MNCFMCLVSYVFALLKANYLFCLGTTLLYILAFKCNKWKVSWLHVDQVMLLELLVFHTCFMQNFAELYDDFGLMICNLEL